MRVPSRQSLPRLQPFLFLVLASLSGAAWSIDLLDPLADPGIRAMVEARQAALAARPRGAPALSLDIRVTTNTTPTGCIGAGNGPINVIQGTSVQYCYNVQNIGDTAFSFHDIVSAEFGPVEMGLNQGLAPGAATLVRKVVTANGDQLNIATWYGRQMAPGYTQITGTCTFPELAPTGTAFNLGDDGSLVVPLTSPALIWGATTSELYVCNNGFVSYPSNSASCPFTNAAFPAAVPALSLAPYWDDFDSETGTLYRGNYIYTSIPRSARGTTSYSVIQWDNRSHFPGPSASTATFALGLIHPGQGIDGYLFMCYQDTNFGSVALNYGASATVGVNRNAGLATQFSFNTANQAMLGGPSTGLGYMPTNTGIAAQTTDTAIVTVTPDLIFANGFQL